jgi:hypothetical protein
VQDAHGVSDLNALSFGPPDLTGQASGLVAEDFPDAPQQGEESRFQEVGEDEDEEMGEGGAAAAGAKQGKRWDDLICSTGDDGTVRVWRVPA